MEISKQLVVDLLRSKGQGDQADRAANELPDTVDVERHGDQLAALGVDPKEFLADLGGGLPNL
jgi:hypothetical protein